MKLGVVLGIFGLLATLNGIIAIVRWIVFEITNEFGHYFPFEAIIGAAVGYWLLNMGIKRIHKWWVNAKAA